MRKRAWSHAPAAVLALGLLASCGRSGYDLLSEADGGIPDDGGGLPLSCEQPNLLVTTSADENDSGESADPPHQGGGLSLREAIGLANARPGRDCIGFAGPMSLVYATELPALVDPEGTTLDGEGQVILSGAALAGIRLASPGNLVRGLEIMQFALGIAVEASPATLERLVIHDTSELAVLVGGGSQEVDISLCVIYSSGSAAVRAPRSTGLRVRHCTIVDSGASAIEATGETSGLVLLNSILAGNRGWGVEVDDPAAVATLDHSIMVGNQRGVCSVCTAGDSVLEQDPLFVAPLEFDYTLQEGSPAIDGGIETGLDTNGAEPGLYNGAGPDLGGLESPPI
jgi:hypothetical protein